MAEPIIPDLAHRTRISLSIKIDVREKITILTEYGKHDINIF
jgi:hypothetical protein